MPEHPSITAYNATGAHAIPARPSRVGGMSDVIITVRGEAESRVAPEEAVARVSAVVDGPDRADVVGRVGDVAGPLRAELSGMKDAGTIADWTAQRAAVWSERPWNSEGRQLDLVHHARIELTATFTDPGALSDWLNAIAARDGVQVGDVSWRLTPATRARIEQEVAAQAVHVAVDRARSYAAAIGRDTVEPLEIADLGLLADAREAAFSAPMMKAGLAADAVGGAIDARPDDITVTAAVEARFRAV